MAERYEELGAIPRYDRLAADEAEKARLKHDDEVQRLGTWLFERLLHRDLQALYWSSVRPAAERGPGDPPATLQIVSDEPHIPWEILLPTRELADLRVEPDDRFLCQRFGVSRWLSAADSQYASPLRLLRVTIVAPRSNLEHVAKEIEAIQALPGVKVGPIIRDKAALDDFLKNGETDVLHFACHGAFRTDDPGRSILMLGDDEFSPDDITGPYKSFGRTRPLVFLNACDSGRQGIGLTAMDGWATAFLEADAGSSSARSGRRPRPGLAAGGPLLRAPAAGDPVAEALRQARDHVRRSGDATYLSYTLYARSSGTRVACRLAGRTLNHG